MPIPYNSYLLTWEGRAGASVPRLPRMGVKGGSDPRIIADRLSRMGALPVAVPRNIWMPFNARRPKPRFQRDICSARARVIPAGWGLRLLSASPQGAKGLLKDNVGQVCERVKCGDALADGWHWLRGPEHTGRQRI